MYSNHSCKECVVNNANYFDGHEHRPYGCMLAYSKKGAFFSSNQMNVIKQSPEELYTLKLHGSYFDLF